MTRAGCMLVVFMSAGSALLRAQAPVDLLPRAAGDELDLVVGPAKYAQPADAHARRCESAANTCSFGRLGAVGDREVFVLQQQPPASVPDNERQARTVVLDRATGATGPLRPLLEVGFHQGDFAGGTAELHATGAGTLIAIRIDVPGTGNFNSDVLLYWAGGRWLQIDPNAWVSELRLPTCYAIAKGRRADLKTWSGQSSVWVAGDPNCCPSGGEIKAALEIRDRAIRVREQARKLVPLELLQNDPDRAQAVKACLALKPKE